VSVPTPVCCPRQVKARGSKELAALLVGAGRRGLKDYLPVLERLEGVRLAGIVDVPARVAHVSAAVGQRYAVYGALDGAIAATPVDFAIVATPDATHLEAVSLLLASGIPTLVEKPPVRRSAELHALVGACRDSATPLATVLPLRHDARYFAAVAAAGDSAIELEIVASVPGYGGIGNWRREPELAAGGVLFDLGYHYVDLLLHLYGVPDAATVRVSDFVDTSMQIESRASLGLRYGVAGPLVGLHLDARPSARSYRRVRWRGLAVDGGRPGGWRTELLDEGRTRVATTSRGKHRLLAALLRHRLLCGFLDGEGGWLAELEEQCDVLRVIEWIYQVSERNRGAVVGVG
jgi:predicted dehydrogenase